MECCPCTCINPPSMKRPVSIKVLGGIDLDETVIEHHEHHHGPCHCNCLCVHVSFENFQNAIIHHLREGFRSSLHSIPAGINCRDDSDLGRKRQSKEANGMPHVHCSLQGLSVIDG